MRYYYGHCSISIFGRQHHSIYCLVMVKASIYLPWSLVYKFYLSEESQQYDSDLLPNSDGFEETLHYRNYLHLCSNMRNNAGGKRWGLIPLHLLNLAYSQHFAFLSRTVDKTKPYLWLSIPCHTSLHFDACVQLAAR